MCNVLLFSSQELRFQCLFYDCLKVVLSLVTFMTYVQQIVLEQWENCFIIGYIYDIFATNSA
jgi:hypothetical protein